ncbi:MAG: homoserine O-acetyltransferase [Planctomycetes bacterium]|nr:homoserine O-acetyltransferase [Planctomycetota bacterium]
MGGLYWFDVATAVTEVKRDKLANSVGIVQTQTVRLFDRPGDELRLECGRTLAPVDVAYETYGTLNAERTNAVLICHALTGDAHVAGWHSETDRKPGWWDIMVGPGKGIDTHRYFVICSNVLGGCRGTTGPSCINPATGRPWGLDFPVITIEDMVKVQKRLVEHLGIRRLLCVTGGSMGGMQVLEWTVRYPEAVASAIPIATTARLNAQSIAFDAVGRSAILADPNYANGQYHQGPSPDRGLAIARMVGHITYLSEQGMHEKFGRQLRNADTYKYDFTSEFSVETYLDHQGRIFVERFDANSYLYITKAVDYYDLGAQRGSVEAAFKNVQARFLVISFSSDWLFTSPQSRQIVDALLANDKDVSYSEVNSRYGHDAFLLEPEVLGRLIGGFLARVEGRPVLQDSQDLHPYRQKPDVESAWRRRRIDYERIEDLIARGSRVLDLGCGRGILLSLLQQRKQVDGLGVEVVQADLCECIDRGLRVLDLDIETELGSFATGAYDYVILAHTLQTLTRPDRVLREMLRVGRQGIVSFPNFAYWRSRWQMAVGRAPVTETLPYRWYNTPNRHFLSIADFEDFCRDNGIRISRRLPLIEGHRGAIHLLPNLRASEAIFVISNHG